MKIATDVLTVLSAATTTGNSLVLNGQLDRKLYERTNKVLEACGGKWNRGKKAHVFDTDAADRIDQIILTGEVEVPKDEFNYFPTPASIARWAIERAQIEKGMKVLEPSAGKGGLAYPCVNAGAIVDCFELMEANYAALAGDLNLRAVVKTDFLSVTPTPIYDRVVMNPPFQKQQDIKHVLHAFQFLKPGGLLVAIMSASVTFRDNLLTTGFRMLVDRRGGTIELLPEGSFKESGTMVNTVIVTIPA